MIDQSTVPCLHATQATTAVAAPEPATDSTGAPTSANLSKPRPSGPKIGFPATHLAELYNLIHGNTNIKPDLVAQLRRQFDETITSKAAIEAKVKEVAIREGKTKGCQWKVKPEAWVSNLS
jgi:chromatin assembly factor 1 subunit A